MASNDRDHAMSHAYDLGMIRWSVAAVRINVELERWLVDSQDQHFLRDFETYSDDFEILFVHNAANKQDKGTAYTRTLQLQPAKDHHRDQLKCLN